MKTLLLSLTCLGLFCFPLSSFASSNCNITEGETKPFSEIFADKNLASCVARHFDKQETDSTTAKELREITEIRCSQENISHLSSLGCFTNLQTLGLSENKITSIEQGGFEGLTNLQALNLNDNQITSIEQRGFEGLTNLQTLYLGGNQITSIEQGDFDGLTNLQELYLGGNQITSIEQGDFEGLTNLQGLYLWGNQITSIEQGDFEGLTNLQRLFLGNNQITSIEQGDFEGLTNLQWLYLNSNQITSIEPGDFEGLTNLQKLGLSENQITSIEQGDFEGLTNLQRLFLSENKITNIEEEAKAFLRNLKQLSLDNKEELLSSSSSFSDVTSSTKFSSAITYIKEKGYVQGFGDGTFRPEHKISRYEFAKIIISTKYSDEEITACDLQTDLTFPDVPKDEWFSPYVCIAQRDKIVKGFSSGDFGGTHNVTATEALKILLETYEIDISSYEDGETWYGKYQEAAKDLGLTSDISDDPQYHITRAEMAELIYQIEQ